MTVGGQRALVSFASDRVLSSLYRRTWIRGRRPFASKICQARLPVSVGGSWATGLHQVDNPVFDRDGNLFVTYSGSRGQESPVSIFRVNPSGTREPFVSGIVNATSMVIGPDGKLYVSSRFEGAVYRVTSEGKHELVVSELGVACGLAFDRDGSCMSATGRARSFEFVRIGPSHSPCCQPALLHFIWRSAPRGELFASGPTLDLRSRLSHRSRRQRAFGACHVWASAGTRVLAG